MTVIAPFFILQRTANIKDFSVLWSRLHKMWSCFRLHSRNNTQTQKTKEAPKNWMKKRERQTSCTLMWTKIEGNRWTLIDVLPETPKSFKLETWFLKCKVSADSMWKLNISLLNIFIRYSVSQTWRLCPNSLLFLRKAA